jgi:hypothetical protein
VLVLIENIIFSRYSGALKLLNILRTNSPIHQSANPPIHQFTNSNSANHNFSRRGGQAIKNQWPTIPLTGTQIK